MAEPEEPKQDPITQGLREWDPQSVGEVIEFRGELTIVVPRTHLVRACQFLKDTPSLAFSFLSDITVVDRYPIEPRFEINYHLLSIPHRRFVRLRVRVAGSDPAVPSLTPLWSTANWHEREQFDLFGIRFEGHPNLIRIILPEDWEGFPLRKDYPTTGYR
jgi:NADH-quinone oxidoreductase subunit C